MSEVRLTGLGKAMAKQMARSWEAPQFTLYTTVNCENLIQYRAGLGYKPSYTTLLLKALTQALPGFPALNSSWDDGTKVIRHEELHLGVAVDTPRGLLVPVVHGARDKSLRALHDDMQAIKEKSKTGAFSMEDLAGGTFVVSNLGMFNVTRFGAIVNSPNAAILSVGKMTDVPVWRGGAFVPEKVMELGLSLDHRVADGATGAKFLTALAHCLENPSFE